MSNTYLGGCMVIGTRRLVVAFGLIALTLATAAWAAEIASEHREAGERGRLRERLQSLRDRSAMPAHRGPIAAPGDYRFILRHDGRERFYLVHVPRSYRTQQPAPVVIALHGGGGGAAYQSQDEVYGLISKSEEAGFIAVFPNGISALPSGMLATWNAGACCGRARDTQVDDVGFIREVVANLQRNAAVDARRVYAIGMSNGAMLAYRLACEAPGLVDGIMAVAGTDSTARCAPRTPTPVLHVHALDDDHVLYHGGRGPAARDPSKEADYVSVPATVAKWVGHNRAVTQPTRALTVPGAYCDLHTARQGGAPVMLCVTETGGHSWPGGGAVRGKQPSQALSANDVMWRFFSTL
jgi:polyhydroxybutyrate depolymerase